MYESLTYDDIKRRMIAVVREYETPDLVFDKRDGSIVNVALSPFAVESKNMFIALDWLLKQMFADTADREYLIKHCAERGITPYYATKALRLITVTFSAEKTRERAAELLEGEKFNRGALNYTILSVDKAVDDGESGTSFECTAECDTYGTEGNPDSGPMTPVGNILDYTAAELRETPITEAVDDEATEDLRERYFRSFDVRFGGNVADYREFVGEIAGVGGVRVRRAWNDGGYVEVYVQSESHGKVDERLVDDIQAAVDPFGVTSPADGQGNYTFGEGIGLGIAPIGHRVRIYSVTEVPIDISGEITLDTGAEWGPIREEIKAKLEEYYATKRALWEGDATYEGETIEVSWASIFTIITQTVGVSGVSHDLQIRKRGGNWTDNNIILAGNEVPVKGRLNEFVVSGTVSDANGDPVEEVEVVIGTGQGRTDADGHYEIETEGGTVAVSASKVGYLPYADTVEITEDTEIDITLAQAVNVSGYVLDGNGNPIEGVHIVFDDGENTYTDDTGADGKYNVGVPTNESEYGVSYTKTGYETITDTLTISADTELDAVTLTAEVGVTYTVKVKVADMDVYDYYPSQRFVKNDVCTLSVGSAVCDDGTDGDGYITVEDIPSGTHTFTVDANGYLVYSVDIPVGVVPESYRLNDHVYVYQGGVTSQTIFIEISLNRAFMASGTVTLDGTTPASGAEVRYEQGSAAVKVTTTSTDGTYSMRTAWNNPEGGANILRVEYGSGADYREKHRSISGSTWSKTPRVEDFNLGS